MAPKARSGFTLIELLIVCAIISILASLAVVNYQEAVTRTKVTRMKADMRTMTTALEAYAADYNHYPVRHHRWELGKEDTTVAANMMHEAPFTEKLFDPDGDEAKAPVGLHVMTTPIAYLSCLPEDVFFPSNHKVLSDKPAWYGYG